MIKNKLFFLRNKFNFIPKNKYLWTAVLFLSLSFWAVWFYSVTLGHDLDFYYNRTLGYLFSLPFTLREFYSGDGLGENSIATLWTWPYLFLSSGLINLGISYQLIIKLVFFLPIICLSLISIYQVFKYVNIQKYGLLFGTLLFSLNSYLLLLVDGGQIGIALAYSILPLCFILYKKYIDRKTGLIPMLLSVIGLSIFDLRIVTLFFILIFIDFLINIITIQNIHIITRYVKFTLLVFLSLFVCHAYWILPSVLSKGPELPQGYNSISQVEFLSFAKLSDGLFLHQPHWYSNYFGVNSTPGLEFLFIPILVLLAPVIKRKDPHVLFWLIITILSIFLIKGNNPPFGDVYNWLFLNVPGFSLFRDPTKFFILLSLAYSVLLGVTVENLLNKIRNTLLHHTVILSLVLLFLLLTNPLWMGKLNGLFSQPLFFK